jgi:hypothetical protein
LLLFKAVFQYGKAKWLRIILILLFVFEGLHGVYFTIKSITNQNEIISSRSTSSAVKKIVNNVSLMRKTNDIALITSDNILRRYALIKGIPAFTFGSGEKFLPHVTKESNFIIATHLQDSTLLKKFRAYRLHSKDTVGPFVMHFLTIK